MTSEIDNPHLSKIRNKTIRWYKASGRNYPWRETSDIYQILIAEMMLRRTTAAAVSKVYPEFLKKYPDVTALAEANHKELQDSIQSLGLQVKRANDLRNMAMSVVENLDGNLLTIKEILTDLPGVGPYVAAAVRNFAFGVSEHMVDGNIVHFLGRVLGVHLSGPTDDNAWQLMKRLGGRTQPKELYWGIIDLVATLCLRRHPRCSRCPLTMDCMFSLNHNHTPQ